MDITYLGHSAFKLRGKIASVVTDPYTSVVGFDLPKVSADIVTVSHQHEDHNASTKVSGTSRRPEPYVIQAPGEYEVCGVGVFGWQTFHDDKEGKERGKNTVYIIHLDGLKICHLGDLGHALSESQIHQIGEINVLLIPVGGFYTINAKQAVEVTKALQPSIVIPMHYQTPKHNSEAFAQVAPVTQFLTEMGIEEPLESQEKLTLTPSDLPEETVVTLLQA
jgi:L-ascorbate metabolism protein UlaG (beta-lactamase superfamily)